MIFMRLKKKKKRNRALIFIVETLVSASHQASGNQCENQLGKSALAFISYVFNFDFYDIFTAGMSLTNR